MFNIFSKNGIILFLFTLPILLFSISIHEFSHAYIAYKLGDKSQKAYGRLTLDPFKHIDIFSLICVALFGFGWGKPIIVDDKNFKNKARDNMLVALAGPLSNFFIAILLTILLKILFMCGIVSNVSSSVVISSIFSMLVLAIEFNVVFFVFNLIPIPPFDGSRVLTYFLPQKGKEIMYLLENYTFWILIIFLVTDLGTYIVTPIVNFIFKILSKLL